MLLHYHKTYFLVLSSISHPYIFSHQLNICVNVSDINSQNFQDLMKLRAVELMGNKQK